MREDQAGNQVSDPYSADSSVPGQAPTGSSDNSTPTITGTVPPPGSYQPDNTVQAGPTSGNSGLPSGASGNPYGQINWAPGTASQSAMQGLAAPTPTGGTTTVGQSTGTYAAPAPAPTTPAGWNTNGIDLTGIDPRLVSFFQSNNLQPTGRGTGNTDIAYWNDLLSQPGADWGYLQGRILGQGGGGGGTPNTGNAPVTTGPGNQFADPATQALNALAQQYGSVFQQEAQQQNTQLQQLQTMLQQSEAAAQQRASAFAGQLQDRITQLQTTPLYTDSQTAAIRQQASEGLQASRDQAVQNARQQTFARGFAPTSGVLNDQINQINQQDANAQSNIDAQLLASQGQANEQRLNEATQLQGIMEQALQGGDITGLQEQAQAADAQIQQQNITRQQMMDALSTTAIPVSLVDSGVNTALQSLNSAGSPGSTLSQMMTLLGLGNTQQGLQQTNQNNTATGIGQLLGIIMNGFSS